MIKSSMVVGMLGLMLLSTQAAAVWTNGEIGEGEDTYLGIQYSQMTYEHDDIPGDFKPALLMLRAGGDINRYLAVEARAGGGFESDKHASVVNGNQVSFEMDLVYLYGLYAVGTLPVTPMFDVYGVVGYNRAKADISATSAGSKVSGKETENDFAYGLGLNFNIDPAASLSLEYMSYVSKSNFDARAIAIGLSNRF